MSALARNYIWWPGIDKAIEETAKTCYQLIQAEPSTAPAYPWEWPSPPWQRIHIDFAGVIPQLHVFDCRGCSFQMVAGRENGHHDLNESH